MFDKNRAPRRGESGEKGKVTAIALSALMLTQTFGAVTPAYANTVGGGSSEDGSTVEAGTTTVDDNGAALTSLSNAPVLRSRPPYNDFTVNVEEIENADIAYIAYHRCRDDRYEGIVDSGEVDTKTTLIFKDLFCADGKYEDADAANGYVLFFVKPKEGYLLTDLGVDEGSNGDFYSLQDDNEDFGNIKDYPDLKEICDVAKEQGYIGVFGWSRKAGSQQSRGVSTTVKAQKPGLSVAAESDRPTGVKPGDTITFTVTFTPQLPQTERTVVATGVSVNSATINGQGVKVENITPKGDGTYEGTVTYKVSQAAYDEGTVKFAVDASVDYSVQARMRDDGQSVTTKTTVSGSASCDCQVAPTGHVSYKFVDTSGYDVPAEVEACLPSDDAAHYEGDTVTPAEPTQKTVKVADGTWTFKGWDHDSATMTRHGVGFIGTWEFVSDKASDHIVLTGKDASKTYDGSALAAAAATATDDNGYAVTVEYQKADGTWTTNPADITASNVADSTTVNVRASVADHYDGYAYATQKLTVAKRSVVLTSASAEKTYNGKALTNDKVTVSGDGFVSGQGATYSVTGSQTEVGESENAFTYTLSAGTDANNYDVKTVFGTLKVTKAGDATPSKKEDGEKPADGKDNGSAAKKSATPKTGDALLANEVLAAAGGTGALGVIAAAFRRRKK